MSRVKIGLNKTSKQKLKKFSKCIEGFDYIEDKEEFINQVEKTLANEIYSQKNCSERAVTDYFFETLQEQLNKDTFLLSDFLSSIVIVNTRKKLSKHYTAGKNYDNNVDIYFNDVKREYIMHPQNESNNLEFTPENYDIFIKNNLKLVVSCAKQYQNKGLPFEDLIQLGNEGLLMAIEHFDANRGNLKIAIKKLVEQSDLNAFTAAQAEEIIRKGFTYNDNLQNTLKHVPQEGFSTKDEFIVWINKYVKTAVFASVAFMWIRANIINELERIGTIIRVPKKTIKQTDTIDGELYSYLEESNSNRNPLTVINLDSVNPYTDDCYYDNELSKVTQEQFIYEDEALEYKEKTNTLKELVESALNVLSPLDRRIIKKRFGIGVPYELSINDIAEQENMNINKVKYSISSSLATIANSFNAIDKETILQIL